MRKFDETYERLLEQYRLDESFFGDIGRKLWNMAKAPFKAYKDAIKTAVMDNPIGRAFSDLQGKDKTKPSKNAKGLEGIIDQIKGIIDETAKSSTKQITFKNLKNKTEEKFTIDDFFKAEKQLDSNQKTSIPNNTKAGAQKPQPQVLGKRSQTMQFAKQSVSTMDFSSMVDSSQNLIKSAIKTLTSDKKWKQQNPDVKVNENEILAEIKKILKAQISRANTKVKFEDKLVWLYLLAPSTYKI
jgi:HSP90 family molecular chaperone